MAELDKAAERRNLLEQHAEELRAQARQWTGSPEAAEELVQDTFASALSSINGLRNPDALGAWLLQILRHRWIDLLRRRTREKRLQGYVPPATLSAEQGSFDRELLRKALLSLNPDERRILEWRFFHSRSSADIARRLGKPPGTIRSMIFTALRKCEAAFVSECE